MKALYSIVMPAVYGFPIKLFNHADRNQREVSLSEVKDAVFKAVLQGHHIFAERGGFPIDTVIYIVHKDEFARSRQAWIDDNADKSLGEAMKMDEQS